MNIEGGCIFVDVGTCETFVTFTSTRSCYGEDYIKQ